MAGLSNIRESDQALAHPQLDSLDIDLSDSIELDNKKTAIEVELPDGSVIINLGTAKKAPTTKFDANLAEYLDDGVLGSIADELLMGIQADDESRKEWLDMRAESIKLLGFKNEGMWSQAGGANGSVAGISTIRHPLLTEAVLRFQANARGELLPSDGPCKVRIDNPNSTTDDDILADALEKDLNHYLTVADKDFVPDTDALLFRVGLDGCGFKKVYHDPIKQKPVSLSVNAEDIIVSNSAVSLRAAARLTHRIFMRQSILKRMQILGAYREVEISDAGYLEASSVDREIEQATGLVKNQRADLKDNDYELYECYCELEIEGFEHKIKGKVSGLPLPYKVVIEKNSKTILEIRRNYEEKDKLCLAKCYFVQYPFVVGLGFYGIGLSHILGNTTNSLTAAWRLFLDAGMFANFPGFLYAKTAGRQDSNIFNIPPGGGTQIETGGMPIKDAVMPLPYKEAGAGFIGFIQSVAETGARVGGTAEMSIGEGAQNAPVGTTIALIEQATKIMDAVHKRLHAAQADELQLLLERLREDPEAFWRFNKKPAKQWDVDQFNRALDNYSLVPQSDPNVSSHMQRIAKAQALYMMAKDDPSAFDLIAVRRAAIKAIGYNQPDQFFQQPHPPAPDPKVQVDLMAAQADLIDSQTKKMQAEYAQKRDLVNDQNRDLDRQSDEKIAETRLETERVIHNLSSQESQRSQAADHMHELTKQIISPT